MSIDPIDQRCIDVAQANANQAHEGFKLTPEMADLQRRYITGEIDLAAMEREITSRWQARLAKPL
jgi:Antitoxin VbhA